MSYALMAKPFNSSSNNGTIPTTDPFIPESPERNFDKALRIAGTGSALLGVGMGIYRGYQDSPSSYNRLYRSVNKLGIDDPQVARISGRAFREELLQDAFSAGDRPVQ